MTPSELALKKNNYKFLMSTLEYSFKNIELLKQALTHRSHNLQHNERLEFLGDSILNMVIAEELFLRYSSFSEGKLSRLRSFLVKGVTLAEVAQEIQLGEQLLLGIGEMKSGGFRRASILADCVEAVIAAVFLDSNFAQAKKLIIRLFASRLADPAILENTKDAKTLLQEYLQANKLPLPIYSLECSEGKDHEQTFYITCKVTDMAEQARGIGKSRRLAEQIAAAKFLKKINKA